MGKDRILSNSRNGLEVWGYQPRLTRVREVQRYIEIGPQSHNEVIPRLNIF